MYYVDGNYIYMYIYIYIYIYYMYIYMYICTNNPGVDGTWQFRKQHTKMGEFWTMSYSTYFKMDVEVI